MVLPMPPGPTMVTKRWRGSCSMSAATLSARSIMSVIGAGRRGAVPGGGRRDRSARLVGAAHRRDEAIAPAGHRRQIPIAAAGVAERPPRQPRTGPSDCPPQRRCSARPEPSARSCRPARRAARPARSGSPKRGCRAARVYRPPAAAGVSGAGETVRMRPWARLRQPSELRKQPGRPGSHVRGLRPERRRTVRTEETLKNRGSDGDHEPLHRSCLAKGCPRADRPPLNASTLAIARALNGLCRR